MEFGFIVYRSPVSTGGAGENHCRTMVFANTARARYTLYPARAASIASRHKKNARCHPTTYRIKAKSRYKCAIKEAVIAADEDLLRGLVNHLCKGILMIFGKHGV